MSLWSSLSSRNREPVAGEEVRLLDPAGEPSDRYTKVKAVLSQGTGEDEGFFEIVDRYNRHLVVTEFTDECPWIQVEYDL